MTRQLTLLETPARWRLDEPTREAGRRGVAEARASLQAALAARSTDTEPGQGSSAGRSAA